MLATPGRGTVYGVLLNHADARAALGEAVHAAPYKAPPRAPVLYIKPRNTWIGPGGAIFVPSAARLAAEAEAVGAVPASGAAHGVPASAVELEIGATLGLVIGRTACRVDEAVALEHVAGCAIVIDVSLPHASYYRPSLRYKARDTFCAIGPTVSLEALTPAGTAAAWLAAARLSVTVDGRVVHRAGFGEMLRSPAQLLAEVSEFMTLVPGDVLMLGVAAGAPRARAGQRIEVEIDGLGRLAHPLVEEPDEAPPVLAAPRSLAGLPEATRPGAAA